MPRFKQLLGSGTTAVAVEVQQRSRWLLGLIVPVHHACCHVGKSGTLCGCELRWVSICPCSLLVADVGGQGCRAGSWTCKFRGDLHTHASHKSLKQKHQHLCRLQQETVASQAAVSCTVIYSVSQKWVYAGSYNPHPPSQGRVLSIDGTLRHPRTIPWHNTHEKGIILYYLNYCSLSADGARYCKYIRIKTTVYFLIAH